MRAGVDTYAAGKKKKRNASQSIQGVHLRTVEWGERPTTTCVDGGQCFALHGTHRQVLFRGAPYVSHIYNSTSSSILPLCISGHVRRFCEVHVWVNGNNQGGCETYRSSFEIQARRTTSVVENIGSGQFLIVAGWLDIL